MHDALPLPDVAILVMGLTGAGKSTFISRLTQEAVEIGHSLESCTTEVYGHIFHRANGQRVFLIDTPGFDDTHNDNVKVLQKIATFLCTIYDSRCLSLAGLIYLQRITDTRMSGSSLTSLRIFEKLCGQRNFANTMIVTTMWGLLQTKEARTNGLERYNTLMSTPEYFGSLVAGGARMTRHKDTFESALEVVEYVAERNQDVVLDIQREIMNRGTLAETTVGQFLSGEFQRTRAKYHRDLEELEEALEEARQEQDDDLITTISEQKREYEEKIRFSEMEQNNLAITYQQMTQDQSEIYAQRYEEESTRGMEVEEKSKREIELEEQLERTEMEHIREMNILRREKMSQEEVPEEHTRRYKEIKRRVLDQLAREKAEREKKGSKRFKALTNREGFIGIMRAALNTRRGDPFPEDTEYGPTRRSSKSGLSRGGMDALFRRDSEKDRPFSHHMYTRDHESMYTDAPLITMGPQRAATFATYPSTPSPPVEHGSTSMYGKITYALTTEPIGPQRNPYGKKHTELQRGYDDQQ
ncbi:hypothetical protein K505DRAFT_359286 [Melanomma pulvis-pyrius CBS 109.77]|uniref:G domain-containing protein n=1 Tax=Melanomma pulvis-pyrius CBS 109.77 TaxID=1314802 RepID=A0A6A6XJ00_9PLEO|nr:hypothetical protein K505DRAFT_359286 [Melanomma pulvis-pyrius CBS 109.77]